MGFLGKFQKVREMAAQDIHDAIAEIPADVPHSLVLTKLQFSKHGHFDQAFRRYMKKRPTPGGKAQKLALMEELKLTYNAVEFSIDGRIFYANIEYTDDLLSLFRSLHATENPQDA